MNKVILSGNLTRDVEARYTHSGKAFIRNAIAVKRTFSKDKETDFFNIVIWDKLAEICANYLSKGSKVLVEGRLQNSKYKYKYKDGNKKSAAPPEGFEGEPIDDSDTPF